MDRVICVMRRGSRVERAALLLCRVVPRLCVMAARVEQDYTTYTQLLIMPRKGD